MLRLISHKPHETGAIAVIVAVLFGFGVMVGAAALTIDVGNINADRRQLQNGADAVALAFAQQCATNATCDPTDPMLSLEALANANAADGFTTISRVDSALGTLLEGKLAICGNLANAANLPECPDWVQSVTNLQECPPAPSSGVKYVRVYTQTTLNDDGDHLLPYSFGAAIAGGGSGANQQACASVALGSGYGAPAAVADSLCAWNAATNGGTEFPALPPYIPAPKTSPLGAVPVEAKYVVKVALQGTGALTDPEKCGKTVSGQYYPGNFGWLDVKSGTTCTAAISSDEQTVGGNPGGPAPNTGGADCSTYLTEMIGDIIYIPIFQSMVPGENGQNAQYVLDGVSAFFLAGWQAPSDGGGNVPTPAYDATLPANPTVHCFATGTGHDGGCLWGWYLSPIVSSGSISEGTARGPKTLGLNG